jgi:uncharacterized protein (DUF427 family)
MKALLNGNVIAESDDIVECDGYQYFPGSSVRMEWLEKSPKTKSDRTCPHGVQFYDVVIEGVRRERVAWSYELNSTMKSDLSRSCLDVRSSRNLIWAGCRRNRKAPDDHRNNR